MRINFLHNGYTVTLVLCFTNDGVEPRGSGVISNGRATLINATPQEALDEIKRMGIDFDKPAIVKV